MSARKGSLLGGGEYEWTSASSKERARHLFLERIAQIAPNVLASLREAPFKEFGEVHNPRSDTVLRRPSGDASTPSLDEWAERWNLNADWLLQIAIDTMGSWCRNPKGRDKAWNLGTRRNLAGTLRPSEMAVRFQNTWNPLTENRSGASKRLREAASTKIEKRLDEIEGLLLERSRLPVFKEGAAPRYAVRRTVQKREIEHFAWLVRYQVLEESFEGVARSAHRSPKAIEHGVKKAAALVELHLRKPSTGGRPLGRKDSKRRTVRPPAGWVHRGSLG